MVCFLLPGGIEPFDFYQAAVIPKGNVYIVGREIRELPGGQHFHELRCGVLSRLIL